MTHLTEKLKTSRKSRKKLFNLSAVKKMRIELYNKKEQSDFSDGMYYGFILGVQMAEEKK
jgi:hypothetical protein